MKLSFPKEPSQPYSMIWDETYARQLRTKACLQIQDLVDKHYSEDWGSASALQKRLSTQALGGGGIAVSLFAREEPAFDSPTIVYSDTRSRWTAVSTCERSFDTSYFDLGRVWASSKAARALSELSANAPAANGIPTGNIDLLLLLLRHAFGDVGDLPPESRKDRLESLFKGSSVHSSFIIGDDLLITMDSDLSEKNTVVCCSTESTHDVRQSESVASYRGELWQGIRRLGQQ